MALLPKSVHDEPEVAVHVQSKDMAPAGSTSVTVAPLAADGPPLATVIVYVVDPPGVAVKVPSVLVIDRSVTATTVVSSVATLFSGVGSTPTPGIDTSAEVDRVPVKVGSIVASTTKVALAPPWRSTVVLIEPVPDDVWHVAEPDAEQVHDTDDSSDGIASWTGASVIVEGPLLVTTIEYWIDVPATAVPLPSVFVIDRSALGLTEVDAVAVLLAGLGSVAPAGAVTVAVLTIVPEARGATTPDSVNETRPPAAMFTVVSRLPLMGPGSAQL